MEEVSRSGSEYAALEKELVDAEILSASLTPQKMDAYRNGLFSVLNVGDVRRLREKGLPLTLEAKGELPFDLANPSGFVGEVHRWILETARCKQPRFALGAALVGCGTIFGRQVKCSSGQHTNLFAINVGRTSCGKDHPRHAIDKLLTECDAEHLRRSKVTSDSAIEVALAKDPNVLLSIDEAGHFLNTVNNRMAASYSRTIKAQLLELWSAAGTTWLGKQRGTTADGKDKVVRVKNPHLAFLGSTQPEVFFDGISRADLRDGWIPRFLFFVSTAMLEPIYQEESEIPAAIKDVVNKWVGKDGWDKQPDSEPIIVGYDAEAAKLRNLCMKYTFILQTQLVKHEPDMVALYGKCMENTERIATILAVGNHADNPKLATISREDYLYAFNLVTFLTMYMEDTIKQNLADTPHERNYKTLLRLIAAAKDKGITKTELTRKTRSIGTCRTRNELLAELIESGDVRMTSIDKGGEKYFAV